MNDKHKHGNGFRGDGSQETDAAHRRFLEKEELSVIYCTSCRTKFEANCMLMIMEHYGNTEHLNFYTNCLYCEGKVHLYLKGDEEKYYHDCYRWRMKLDK